MSNVQCPMANCEIRHSVLDIGHLQWAAVPMVSRATVPQARTFGYAWVAPASQNVRHMPGPRYDLEDRLIRFGADVSRLAGQVPATVLGKHVAVSSSEAGRRPSRTTGRSKELNPDVTSSTSSGSASKSCARHAHG